LSRKNYWKRLDNPRDEPGIPRLLSEGFFIKGANLAVERKEVLLQGSGYWPIGCGMDRPMFRCFSFASERPAGDRPRIFLFFSSGFWYNIKS
jgi:hypothetical protein